MNAVIPLAVVTQLALLGRRRTALQASFGLCVTTTSFGSVVFNFLVDGVTSKVGKSVGAKRYQEAAGHARMAFLAALVCGTIAAVTLLSLRDPLFALFHATEDVAKHARVYFFARSVVAPAQCLANAASGCLGGYKRVHAVTALSACRAICEAASVAFAVTFVSSDTKCFFWVGASHAACVLANAAVGVLLVVALPPRGSKKRLPIAPALDALFARRNERNGETAGTARLTLTAGLLENQTLFEVHRDSLVSEDSDASDASETSSRPESARAKSTDANRFARLDLSFFRDGASMFVRSFLLQGTFFGAMLVASRELGPEGLAAHNVVCQLWTLSSYVVDGFATAGTVVGARLVGEACAAERRRRRKDASRRCERRRRSLGVDQSGGSWSLGGDRGRNAEEEEEEEEEEEDGDVTREINPEDVKRDKLGALSVLPATRSVCHRVLAFGFSTGVLFSLLDFFARDRLIATFTADRSVANILRDSGTWNALVFAQPLNAMVFVYDGLIYAFQDFAFARELMSTGVGFVFLPSLAFAAAKRRTTLADVWRCKIALNAWRFALLAMRTHGWSLTRGGFAHAAREKRALGGGGRGNRSGREDTGPESSSASDGATEDEGAVFLFGVSPETVAAAPAESDAPIGVRSGGASHARSFAFGSESPTSHWRRLGSAARAEDDEDDVEVA